MSFLDVLAEAWLQVALAVLIMATAVIAGTVLLRRSEDQKTR